MRTLDWTDTSWKIKNKLFYVDLNEKKNINAHPYIDKYMVMVFIFIKHYLCFIGVGGICIQKSEINWVRFLFDYKLKLYF